MRMGSLGHDWLRFFLSPSICQHDDVEDVNETTHISSRVEIILDPGFRQFQFPVLLSLQ